MQARRGPCAPSGRPRRWPPGRRSRRSISTRSRARLPSSTRARVSRSSTRVSSRSPLRSMRSTAGAARVGEVPGEVLGEQLGVADDAGQRSAQLVAHRRDELALGPVEVEHPLVGLALLVEGEDERLLGRAAVGDVADHAEVAHRAAVVVAHRRDAHRDGEPAAVLADVGPVAGVLVGAVRDRVGHHAVVGRDAAASARGRGSRGSRGTASGWCGRRRPSAEYPSSCSAPGLNQVMMPSRSVAMNAVPLAESSSWPSCTSLFADLPQRVAQVDHRHRERDRGDGADRDEALRAGGDVGTEACPVMSLKGRGPMVVSAARPSGTPSSSRLAHRVVNRAADHISSGSSRNATGWDGSAAGRPGRARASSARWAEHLEHRDADLVRATGAGTAGAAPPGHRGG